MKMMDHGMGVCAPAPVVDYYDSVGGRSNMYDYYEAMFENDEMMDAMMEGMPREQRPGSFKEFAGMMEKMNMGGVKYWKDIVFEAECREGRRGGRGGRRGEKMMEMLNEEEDQILMTGKDGSILYMRMAATKAAVSAAAALGLMALW